MKIIIPMAGKGVRLFPHTLTTPKSLIYIAGKPIVQRLAENITKSLKTPLEEIIFIIGNYGDEIEKKLKKLGENIGIKISIYHQKEPLGTAHALLCAKDVFNNESSIVIAFSDTLFIQANFDLSIKADGVIWTKKVKNPSSYGIAKCNSKGYITEFIEKPKKFVSNLAIIGIYYIKNGVLLKKELQNLINKKNKHNGEYQLTDALENMKNKGIKFIQREVDEWMDCGNKNSIIKTNSKILDHENNNYDLINPNSKIINSFIIKPCFIGNNTIIKNSKIGPYVSIGNNTIIKNSNIKTSLIQNYAKIEHANLCNSMIGNNTSYIGITRTISLGDYSVFGF